MYATTLERPPPEATAPPLPPDQYLAAVRAEDARDRKTIDQAEQRGRETDDPEKVARQEAIAFTARWFMERRAPMLSALESRGARYRGQPPRGWGDEQAASKVTHRSVEVFRGLLARKGLWHRPPPPVDGLYYLQGIVDWCVWAGYLTDDGRVLVGYGEIAELAGLTSGQSVRSALGRRREREDEQRRGRRQPVTQWDIPQPYRYYEYVGPGGHPRPMWLLEEQIKPWVKRGRVAADGTPTKLRIGGAPPGVPQKRRPKPAPEETE